MKFHIIAMMCTVLISTNLFAASYAKIHVLPLNRTLDWSTPNTLAATTLNNFASSMFLNTSMLGHVFLEYKCDREESNFVGKDLLESSEIQNDMLINGLGYSIFFKKYQAKIEGSKELNIVYQKNKNKVSSIEFNISKKQCVSLSKKINNIRKQKRIPYLLSSDISPNGECSAFVLSLLNKINIKGLDSIINEWKKTFYVPKSILGDGKNKVFYTMLTKNKDLKWDKNKNKDNKTINLIFPELISDWIHKNTNNKKYLVFSNYIKNKIGAKN